MKWLTRRGPDEPASVQRWLVVDVETSGLDPRRDRLLAVAAVGVRVGPQRLSLLPGDSFERVLQQPQAAPPGDKSNILLHGIGVGAQRAGTPGARALHEFDVFVDGAPLLGFHSAFDRAVLERAAKQHLGHGLGHRWADLADLAPVLYPTLRLQSLDDWLAHFDIPCLTRHQAAADAWATAELLQRLWPRLLAEGAGARFSAIQAMATSRRWLAT
ncbi:MAG TPA: 3'-5' exonuclease [Rubrivivax sp.]|nr:3'-5' exonuclease [Rubrivivax sp.]